MNWNQIDQRIRQIYDEMFGSNYSSGSPNNPPHSHNGIDNLQISAQDILGLSAFIKANSSGGGGTPGGTNTQVQYNNNGAFGGDSGLTYTQPSGTLDISNIDNNLQSPYTDSDLGISAVLGTRILISTNNIDSFANPLGPTGNILIFTNDSGVYNTGEIDITAGSSNLVGGKIVIKTSDVNGGPTNNGTSGAVTISTGFSYQNAGNISLTTGNSLNGNGGTISLFAAGSTNGSPGNISLVSEGGITLVDQESGGQILVESNGGPGSSVLVEATNTTSGSVMVKGGTQVELNLNNGESLINLIPDGSGNGQIILDANVFTSIAPYRGGSTTGNVALFFGLSGSALGTGSAGTFFIGNVQNIPSGSPVQGGQFYVSAGALHWLGSSGTDTVIAPA